MQYRQVEADTLAPGDVQIDVGINFAVVGQVDGNMAGAVQVGILQQVQGQVLGGLLLLLETKRAPVLPKTFAEFTARKSVRMVLKRLGGDKLAQNKASRAAGIGCGP